MDSCNFCRQNTEKNNWLLHCVQHCLMLDISSKLIVRRRGAVKNDAPSASAMLPSGLQPASPPLHKKQPRKTLNSIIVGKQPVIRGSYADVPMPPQPMPPGLDVESQALKQKIQEMLQRSFKTSCAQELNRQLMDQPRYKGY